MYILIKTSIHLHTGVKCTLRFARSYSDHMVLQRAPERAILWGYADTDSMVTAFMNGVQVGESAVTNDTNNGTGCLCLLKMFTFHILVEK